MKKLSVIESLKEFLDEMKSIVYNHKGSAYVKFINIAVAIEFLGACMDNKDFTDSRESESRFNIALDKLFPNRYKQYAKAGSKHYLYTHFRCAYVHRLGPGKGILVTHREESKKEGTKHLKPTGSGDLILILEDLFDDLEKASKKLFAKEEKGKLPTRKLQGEYVFLVDIQGNERVE